MLLPVKALSIRQPWAWAIVSGHKDIENRTSFALSKGCAKPFRICVHASRGMTRGEYETARRFMLSLGVDCPLPDVLVRGAIVGMATVNSVIDRSDSPWFFGPRGLVLSDACEVDPLPAKGALGYFRWLRSGSIDKPAVWMKNWN